MTHRTLVIGLDGYDAKIADDLIRAGRLPRIAALRKQCARFELDHGDAKRTGLGWEHVSMGRSPDAYARWSPVKFDVSRYEAVQHGTRGVPFVSATDLRAVVFDPPYFDLSRAPNARGIVCWGAHDPGIAPLSTPASLAGEIEARFGSYPATPFIYGFVWPYPALAREMGEALTRAVDVRAAASRWLLAERLPDWELAIVAVSELHSGLEGLWHGIDPRHPLHALPSAAPCRDGVIAIYEAVDRLVGQLCDAFSDARLVVFSLHGMGPNTSDVAGTLLLPELLYRRQFGRSFYTPRADWAAAPDGIPMLSPGERWSREVIGCLGDERETAAAARSWARGAWRKLGGRRRKRERAQKYVEWMPAVHYRRFWSRMDAFALPAYYEGQVRINLVGRERNGRVSPENYDAFCDALCAVLEACRDPRTGESVVSHIQRPVRKAPLSAPDTLPDLAVHWRGTPIELEHPSVGRVGPAPYRRTGGHTGGFGMAYLRGAGLAVGDYGVRSAFDVVPTMIELCGRRVTAGVSGSSLLRSADQAPDEAADTALIA
jgi:predicted AlkP superfamily phosphohydrolase/phosphomutase